MQEIFRSLLILPSPMIKLQESSIERTAYGQHPSGTKVWVTPPGKEPHQPTHLLNALHND